MEVPKHIETVFAKSKCLFTTLEVSKALDAMAHAIHEKLNGTNPVILCVMIGGLIPVGNLLPRLDFPLEVDYIHATRYRGKTSGSNILHWLAKPHVNLNDRTVLVVDDILDGGITLAAILEYCKEQGAKDVYSAVLVDKYQKRVPGGLEKADFVGLQVEDHYIFGYGMDYHEYLRNAPGIYMVSEGS